MKRALVTGGASPLGAAICRRLAADGLHVTIHAHQNHHAAAELAHSLTGQGFAANTLCCDLTDFEATERALRRLAEQAPPIQVIVHNAGTHDDMPLAGMSARVWRDVLAVSLDGFFAVTRPLLLPMMATRWGRVIALSSVTATLGNRGQVNYGAAKAGLEGAIRSLSRELASRGVTANAVAPGVIASPATEAALDAKTIASLVPMKRAGRPEEVASLVGYLASDGAGYISGQTIGINGGMI
jgi:3-oxoacyl-[acyl-carrier protein] reductase